MGQSVLVSRHVNSEIESMNFFFAGININNNNFYYLRYRLKSLNRGHRRHQLVATSGSRSVPAPGVVSISVDIYNDILNEDDDDNGYPCFIIGHGSKQSTSPDLLPEPS